ncbi:hypothetical protein V6N13_133242 [Hibiscus sabdariffa]|uniref:Uncharacterized protein n=2 Tax=Hibiscus sabdariffa TaxID=183260 RepID=A0ABR2CI73_9ROSI
MILGELGSSFWSIIYLIAKKKKEPKEPERLKCYCKARHFLRKDLRRILQTSKARMGHNKMRSLHDIKKFAKDWWWELGVSSNGKR